MGTYEELKAAIKEVIRTNGNNEITGALLQNTLLSIVNVVGENATFAGIATPNTNPGTADQNVFYLATEAGTYVNFNSIVINVGEAVILSNKTGNWVKIISGFATQQQLTELSKDLFGVAKNTYERKTIGFVVPNKFISLETGKLTNAGGYYSSDFIGLQDVSIIVANSNIPSTIALVAFYANEYEDSFISSLSAEFNGWPIYSKDFPEGARYIRFSCRFEQEHYANIYVNDIRERVENSEKKIGYFSEFVTPQMFGAKGDGFTDDTAAFQKLEGKVAIIPEGEYMVSHIKYSVPTTLMGVGTQKSIIHQIPNSAKSLFEYNSPIGSVLSDIQLLGNLTDTEFENDKQALLKLYSLEGGVISGYGCSFRNLLIKKASANGIVLLGSGSADNSLESSPKALWVFGMQNIVINEANMYGMIDESSDNRFVNFYISAGYKGGLFCKAGSNQYCNFKIDGPNNKGSEDSWDDGALLIVDASNNLQFTNMDLQSGSFVGSKIKNSSYVQFNGAINHCGIMASNGGWAMKFSNVKHTDVQVSLFDDVNPFVQSNGIYIDGTSQFVNVRMTDKNFTNHINNNPQTCCIVDSGRQMKNVFANLFTSTTNAQVIANCDDALIGGMQRIEILANKIANGQGSPNSPIDLLPTSVSSIVVANEKNEGYYSQSLPMAIPLYALNESLRDRLIYQYGHWYLIRSTKTILLDGSENWESGLFSGYFTLVGATERMPDNAICSHFEYKTGVVLVTERNGKIQITNNGDINIGYNAASNVEEFKRWLSANNVLVIMTLESPIETKIMRTEAIKILPGINNVFVNDGKTENLVQFTYIVDAALALRNIKDKLANL